MKAKANAIFISSIYNQEVGDTNWNEYQTIITANSVNELTIRTSDTTANNLSVTSNYSSLVPGSKIYVSNNGTTLIGGTIGVIATGTVKSNTSSKIVDVTRSATTGNTIYNSAVNQYGSSHFIRPDGKFLWICGGNDGVIREYKLNVPWNLASGAATGKSIGAYNSNASASAFCFSYDGKYLFRYTFQGNAGISAAECIARWTLTTPWDISTLGTNVQSRVMRNGSGGNAYNYAKSMRISRDGKTILVWAYQGTIAAAKQVLAVPFDVTSYVSASSYTYSPIGVPSSACWDVSEDGKTWYAWTYIGAEQVNLYQGSFSPAWELNTLAVVKTIPLTWASATYGSASSTYGPVGIISADGKTTGVYLPNNGGTAGLGGIVTFNLDTQGGDAAQSYNIDVTSFGMTAAANRAWLSEPSVYVAATRSANTARTWSYQIDLDTDTAANTTTAVVGIDGTGVLAANDTVLLNGTTSVTLTSVVETANGLPWKDPAGATDYIKYFGKNYQTLNSQSDVTYASGANMNMRFSNNGSYFYIVANSTAVYGSGIYQYVMTSPWDVSTAKFLNYCPIGTYTAGATNALSNFNGGYTTVQGFDIDPNGNRFFIFWGATVADIRAYQYNLSKPHDLNSISSVNGPYTYTTMDASTSGHRVFMTRFNRTGTQILTVQCNGTNPVYTQLLSLGTPWDISSVTSWNPGSVVAASTTAAKTPGVDGCFTPDGDRFLCLGQSKDDSYLTTQPTAVANNSFSGWIWNTKTTTAANIAAYPAGSISATAQSRSIDISPDGTNLYILMATGLIYQFGTRLKPLTKYVITYPAQASAPTSVYLPDPSVIQTFTPSLDNANSTINFSSSFVSANARAIQFEITNAPVDTEVTQVRINLNKSQ